MNVEIDCNLTTGQWEGLKVLRLPAPQREILNQSVVENLIALELATMAGDSPVITPKGRSVLLRGSPRLWDVAA